MKLLWVLPLLSLCCMGGTMIASFDNSLRHVSQTVVMQQFPAASSLFQQQPNAALGHVTVCVQPNYPSSLHTLCLMHGGRCQPVITAALPACHHSCTASCLPDLVLQSTCQPFSCKVPGAEHMLLVTLVAC